MARSVRFLPEAERDLLALFDFIAERDGDERAFRYVERIVDYCRGLATFPARGQLREDLRPGLRVIGFERRAAIAFHTRDDEVVIDRILYGGRDLDLAFGA